MVWHLVTSFLSFASYTSIHALVTVGPLGIDAAGVGSTVFVESTGIEGAGVIVLGAVSAGVDRDTLCSTTGTVVAIGPTTNGTTGTLVSIGTVFSAGVHPTNNASSTAVKNKLVIVRCSRYAF